LLEELPRVLYDHGPGIIRIVEAEEEDLQAPGLDASGRQATAFTWLYFPSKVAMKPELTTSILPSGLKEYSAIDAKRILVAIIEMTFRSMLI
jgi:hypothetical protein